MHAYAILHFCLPSTMGCTASGSASSVDASVYEGDNVNLSRAVESRSPHMWGVKHNGVFYHVAGRYYPVLTFGGKRDFVLRGGVIRDRVVPGSCCMSELHAAVDFNVAQLYDQISSYASVVHKGADLLVAVNHDEDHWATHRVMPTMDKFKVGKVVTKMCGNLLLYGGQLIFLAFYVEF